MNDQHPGGNTGFIAVNPKPGDFIAGGETGLAMLPINPSGDWRSYYPQNASQLMKGVNGKIYGDTNACVSFGALQDTETLLNYRIRIGAISISNLTWLNENGYIDETGRVFLSKRFTARMSNTDPAVGNTLPNVWNSLRHDGAVPDALWPMPSGELDDHGGSGATEPDGYWLIYYRMPPQAAVALGKEFAARFEVLYEWMVYPGAPATPQSLATYLTQAPLEIATAVCAGWNTDDPVGACGAGTQHATLMGCVENDRYDILDHYVPFRKQLGSAYDITYAMRGMISDKVPPEPAPFTYVFNVNLTMGDPASPEVHKLQEALQHFKKTDGTPYMKVGVFGPYGPQTQKAVATFQTDHGISTTDNGVHFGPKTRAAINKLTQ